MKILIGNMSWLNHSTNTPNNNIPDLMLSDTLVSQKNSSEILEMIQQLMINTETPIVLLPLEVDKWLELQRLIKKMSEQKEVKPKAFIDNEDEWITKLRAFILERLGRSDLNIDAIKNHFRVSRSTLYRKLKRYTKLSVTEYIRDIRLEMAVRYLETSDYSVTEISYKTGFSSPSHFSRAFKKAYGKSPSSLR